MDELQRSSIAPDAGGSKKKLQCRLLLLCPYASVSSVVDGAFSIGASQVPATIRYIENQPQRHRKVSLNEEWELFLRKHAMFVDRA